MIFSLLLQSLVGGIGSLAGKTAGTIHVRKKLKEQNEEYVRKIPGFQGSLVVYIINHQKLLIAYYTVFAVIMIAIVVSMFLLDKETGNSVAMIGCIVLATGLLTGILIMTFFTKKINLVYTKHYLFLDDPRISYREKITFSEIEKFFYEKKNLIFVDKNGTSFKLKVSNTYGLPEFVNFLHKNYYNITELMSKADKEKYNKFISKRASNSGLYSAECFL